MLSGGLFSRAVKSVNAEHVAVANLINDFLSLFQDILLSQRNDLIQVASEKVVYMKKPSQQNLLSAMMQSLIDYLNAYLLSMEDILQILYEDLLCRVNEVASIQKEPALHDLVITEIAIALIEYGKNYFQPKVSFSVQAGMLEFLLGGLNRFPVMKHSPSTIYDSLLPHVVALSEMLKSINIDLPLKMREAKILWGTCPVQPSLQLRAS